MLELGQSVVVVVAHPDDETLFAGGLPLHYPEHDWTIICCSIPRIDPIRAWKFQKACLYLNAMPKMLPFVERDPDKLLLGLETLGDLAEYDSIVTHNKYGEYGHLHHAQVSNYIYKLGRPAITFGYHKDGVGEFAIELTDAELSTKQAAMRCYDHELPYNGVLMPKWQALEHRYYEVEGLDPRLETYGNL